MIFESSMLSHAHAQPINGFIRVDEPFVPIHFFSPASRAFDRNMYSTFSPNHSNNRNIGALYWLINWDEIKIAFHHAAFYRHIDIQEELANTIWNTFVDFFSPLSYTFSVNAHGQSFKLREWCFHIFFLLFDWRPNELVRQIFGISRGITNPIKIFSLWAFVTHLDDGKCWPEQFIWLNDFCPWIWCAARESMYNSISWPML